MEILLIFIILPAVVGVVIALYEWRKGRTIVHDTSLPTPHDSDRAAHTKAERLRTEGVMLQDPSSGHY